MVARSSVPQAVERPIPEATEQDPTIWWRAAVDLAAATLGTLPGSRHRDLAGIAISGHYPTLLLADRDGHALAPAMLYGDRRADAFVDEAAALGGEALAGDEWLPKLLYLRREAPELLDRTARLFNPHDHVAFRLTGELGLDHRSARRSGGLFDPVACAWRADVAAAVGLRPAALPPIRRAGELLGSVTATAAAESCLPAGTPVVVGLGDTPAEIIGAGVARPGDVLLYYGTTSTCDACTHDVEAYLHDPSAIADWAPYHEVAYAVLGPALPWVAGGLLPDAVPQDLASLDAAAAAIRPSIRDPYVLPFFLAHARAGTAIRRPAFIGLDVGHSRADLHRAVLESFGLAARAGLDAAGIERDAARFVATGGGARSSAWRQIVSDAVGVRQDWLPSSDAALGSAALAAWATVGAPSIGDSWGRRPATPPTVQHPASRQVMTDRYETWLRLRGSLLEALNPGTAR